MGDSHRWSPQHVLLVIVLAAAVTVSLAAAHLEVSPHRVTPGTIVAGTALLVGSLALPALLFSRWVAATD